MSTTETPPRRLVRRTDDRVVAGVASGVADVLGIDPVLARIGFVVLAFAGGAGVIAYLALWLLTPEVEGGATPVEGSGDRGPAFWIAIGLFVLAALAIADSMADRSVVWPLVLIGAGVALWRSDGTRARTGEVAAPLGTAAFPEASAPTQQIPTWTPPPSPSATQRAGRQTPSGPAGPAHPATPAGPGGPPGPRHGDGSGWTPPPARTRERSILGRLTLGAALLTVGVLAILDAAEVLTLTAQDAFAVALLVLGLGLLVGTWVGRARWLVFPALLVLLPGLVITTVTRELDIPLGAGIGERSVGTTAVADVDPLYELGVGDLTLDLGQLDLDGGEVATAVRVGIGQVTIVVPDDARVEVSWSVVGGQVQLLDGDRQGRGLEGEAVFPGAEGSGTIVLDVDVSIGQVELVRESDRGFGSSFGDSFDGWSSLPHPSLPPPRVDPTKELP